MKRIAKKLVLDDNEIWCHKFYNSLAVYTTKVVVFYEPDIFLAIEKIKKSTRPTILLTMILTTDPSGKYSGTHALALIRDGKSINLFDSNGNNGSDSDLFYTDVHRKKISQKAFGEKFKLRIPVGEGVQVFQNTKDHKGYINKGGYCMFYVYVGIKEILRRYETDKNSSLNNIHIDIMEGSRESQLKLFKDIHLQSLYILKDLFSHHVEQHYQ